MQAALDDPATAGQGFEGFAGPTTLEQSVDGFLSVDLVVHGWDLARATGQDERMDPDDVERVHAAMALMGDKLRTPGAFGPEVEPPPDADAQTRLLCFLGRSV